MAGGQRARSAGRITVYWAAPHNHVSSCVSDQTRGGEELNYLSQNFTVL